MKELHVLTSRTIFKLIIYDTIAQVKPIIIFNKMPIQLKSVKNI
jgi:hypothetical protein